MTFTSSTRKFKTTRINTFFECKAESEADSVYILVNAKQLRTCFFNIPKF